jgi:hypothetical protein
MSAMPSEETSSADSRQTVFRALVEAQDAGLTVTQSRAEVARQFSLTEQDVKDIEQEGLANQWPPL